MTCCGKPMIIKGNGNFICGVCKKEINDLVYRPKKSEAQLALERCRKVEKHVSSLPIKEVACELFNIVSNNDYDMNELVYYFTAIDKALDELNELKRYPTADEVCETLGREINDIVRYENGNFYRGVKYEPDYSGIILPMEQNGFVFMYSGWRHHIITLIGRFYEGLEKERVKDE
jgi:hypothetical protein